MNSEFNQMKNIFEAGKVNQHFICKRSLFVLDFKSSFLTGGVSKELIFDNEIWSWMKVFWKN